MLRVLRAFAWMRWRMFVNSLEKTGARDKIERFSVAIEKIGPIMAAVLMIPSVLVLAAAAVASGFALARGNQHSLFLDAARYILLVIPVVSIFGPLLLPAADRTNPVRLLLLPIARSTLYVAQSSTAFGDVWVLLMLPIVLFLPVGLLAGGAFVAAVLSLVGGVLLVLVVVGLSSLSTSLLHLVVRNRRRGELLTLLFILILPAISMLPGLLHGSRQLHPENAGEPPAESRLPPWAVSAVTQAFALYPTELYVRSTRSAAFGDVAPAAAGLVALAATGLLLHSVGMFVFAKVLDSPGSTGARRAGAARAAWGRRLPGLSPGASAVALAHLRLGMRTPRGRSIMLSPALMVAIFGFVMRRPMSGLDIGPFAGHSGLSLAAFGSFVSLMAILPIAMNQFAVDGAGLTMALLSPLTDREYLAGKAVGNGFIAAMPVTLSILISLAILPGGSPGLWLAIPVGLLAIYFVVAPAAAIFSALFPRTVDLNSIGRGSNAHGLSGLLGMLSFVAAAAPCVLIMLVASGWLGQPALAPVLLLAWCVVCYGIGWLLFIPARRIFARRRENLAMLM
jgi:hypothetical protein